MIDLLVVGILIACFVAYNIGGATTGPAFGPAVGADVISKRFAAALMAVFFFVGAWTLGRRVVDTLGTDLLAGDATFGPVASIVVLFFIGGALLAGNLSGAPASTSMTAVGAIAGMGIATGGLDWAVVGEIVSWWIVSPVVGFWMAAVVGRYWYHRLDRAVAIDRTDGPLLVFERAGPLPYPVVGPNTTRRELVGTTVVVGIGCLMAFSSGTSNVANAIAPLVGSGALAMDRGILVASAAVTVGAFTIARRTMETLGSDITDLPLTAAIVVAVLSSGIVVSLSAVGVPASFVVIATMCIVGLGWGRASRTVGLADAVRGRESPAVTVDALAADPDAPTVGSPDAGPVADHTEAKGEPSTAELFDPATTFRVVAMQNVVPAFATVGSFLTFTLFL